MTRRPLPWLLAAGVAAILLAIAGRSTFRSGPSAPRAPAAEPPAAPRPDMDEPTGSGAILVEVVDSRSSEPVRDVDLVLRRGDGGVLDAAFEERGDAWAATGLVPGSYLLSAGALGYGPATVEVEVLPDGPVPVRIGLLRNPAVHGFVTDESGTPLARIQVLFGWTGGAGMTVAYTSRNGAFHIRPPHHDGPEWSAGLVIQDPGGVYAEARAHLRTPTEGEHLIQLARATRVVGRLVPRSGDRVRIHQCHDEGGQAEDVELAADGSFVLTDLPPEQDIRLAIVLPDRAPVVRGPIRLEKAEQRDLGDLEVGTGRSLSLAVRSTVGDPVVDLRVTVLFPGVIYEDDLRSARVVECGSDVAHLDLLPDGPILVHVAARGCAGSWLRIDKVEEFAASEIRLKPAGLLEARVVDPEGRPVKDAVIRRDEERPTFEEDCYRIAETALPPTDAQGRVRVHLAEGVHRLRLMGTEGVAVTMRSGQSTSVELRAPPDPK